MACCLRTLPPLLYPPKSTRRLPARPAARPLQSIHCSQGKTRGGDDDYYATIRALNSRGRRTPRKSLGQHYMLNSGVNKRMADAAEVKEGDVVLEIGPGTGSLTSVLLDYGATVLAVEKDPHMAMLVKDRFGDTNRLVVLEEDFTKCHIHSHIWSMLESKRSMGSNIKLAKVVSNIPFNISRDIIKLVLPLGDIFSDVVLLLQDELALRWVNCSLQMPEYRPINVFVNFYSDPEYKCRVERTSFFPQPNVDAAVVAFKLKRTHAYPPVTSVKGFFSMVNSAFNGKRKMLRKSLVHLCSSSEIENALQIVGLPVTSRPEELTLDDFVSLHNLIMKL